MTFWSRCLAKSCFKLKTYLHYQKAYGHQTWECGDLPWETLIDKVTWTFHRVVLPDHATYYKHNISATAMPMATKLGKVVAYNKELLIIKLHDPCITWSCEITWKIEYFSIVSIGVSHPLFLPKPRPQICELSKPPLFTLKEILPILVFRKSPLKIRLFSEPPKILKFLINNSILFFKSN